MLVRSGESNLRRERQDNTRRMATDLKYQTCRTRYVGSDISELAIGSYTSVGPVMSDQTCHGFNWQAQPVSFMAGNRPRFVVM